MGKLIEGISLEMHAEAIAKTMHEIAHWPKSHVNSKKFNKNLIKLPPVFLLNDEKNGDGLQNLVAMIKTISEYEDGCTDGSYPKLSDLPKLYNKNGGMPNLTSKDLRKIHNWVQQVGFGIRAAIIEQEDKKPLFADWEKIPLAERVYRRLYLHNTRRSFITCSPHNKNEYKPLRYADDHTKLKWINQECEQRKSKHMCTRYGASPSSQEWRDYGLLGQPIHHMKKQIKQKIAVLLSAAEKHDIAGEYEQADIISRRINKMNADLATLENKTNGEN